MIPSLMEVGMKYVSFIKLSIEMSTAVQCENHVLLK